MPAKASFGSEPGRKPGKNKKKPGVVSRGGFATNIPPREKKRSRRFAERFGGRQKRKRLLLGRARRDKEGIPKGRTEKQIGPLNVISARGNSVPKRARGGHRGKRGKERAFAIE